LEPKKARMVDLSIGISMNLSQERVTISSPVTIPSGVVEQEHYHEKVNEFIFFLTKGISRVNGKDYDMHPYDILILDTKERHQIIAKDADVKVLVIKKGIIDKVNC